MNSAQKILSFFSDFNHSDDANEIRIETLSGVADMESLEKMVSSEEEKEKESDEEEEE